MLARVRHARSAPLDGRSREGLGALDNHRVWTDGRRREPAGRGGRTEPLPSEQRRPRPAGGGGQQGRSLGPTGRAARPAQVQR